MCMYGVRITWVLRNEVDSKQYAVQRKINNNTNLGFCFCCSCCFYLRICLCFCSYFFFCLCLLVLLWSCSHACSHANLLSAHSDPVFFQFCRQAGYSSVGRASDCRMLQQSDGPWFDSGWPDVFTVAGSSSPACGHLLPHHHVYPTPTP